MFFEKLSSAQLVRILNKPLKRFPLSKHVLITSTALLSRFSVSPFVFFFLLFFSNLSPFCLFYVRADQVPECILRCNLKKSSSFFSRDCIFGDKPADCKAVFALQFSEITLQPSCLQCRLSSSFNFLQMKFCWFFSSVFLSFLIFFRHGGYCCYVDYLDLNLFFYKQTAVSDSRSLKCFKSCVPMDIFHREDVSHTAGVYKSKCKSFELGIGWIIVVCIYSYENFIKYYFPCEIVSYIHSCIISSPFFSVYFLPLLQSFHQGYWIQEWVPQSVWHFEV